jgi:hypothetical protein
MILPRLIVLEAIVAFAAAAQTSTTITISAPSNTSVFGAAVQLSANVTPSGASGDVTFYDGSNILGISALAGGSATLTTKLLGVGARSLSAHYSGDSGNLPSTSVAVAHTVTSVAAGGFQAAASYSAGTSPNGIAVADFNGDGALDLAVSDYGGTVNVFLGNGDGTFQTAVSYPAGATASAVAAGDFNGDGKVDLAVTNIGSGTVSILLGNGDGSFQTPVPYSVGREPVYVAVADFNGDGKADLAVANSLDGTVSVLMGNGDGTFRTPVPYNLLAAEPSSLAVADLNGDGNPDLVAGTLYGFCTLLGNGDGTLQSPVFYSYGGIDPGTIAVGDFTSGGKLDVVVSLYEFGIEVFPGKGDGTFLAPIASGSQNYGGSLVVGDFDGDGKLDLAITDGGASTSIQNGAVAILLGKGDGTFQSPLLYSVGPPPSYALAAADFNGDGRTDLAATSYGVSGNTVGILLGQSAANPAVSAVSVSPSSGSGPSQTFTFTFSDSGGAADLASVQVLFGSDSAPLACVITYNVAQQTLGLWNDDGSMPVINLQPGFGFVQNSSCLLNAVLSSATLSGNLLTLNVTVGFRSHFQGAHHVYGQAISASGITSGWQMRGSWTGAGATPQPVSVSPANSTAMVQPLTFVFFDANTAADITAVYININSSQSFVNSCFIMVDPIGATFSLANDSNTGWLGPATLGSGLALLNSSCGVIPLQSSATLEANNYVVTLSIRLQTMGVRNIYAQAETRNLLSGSQTLGTWTAGPAPETITLTTSPNPAIFGRPVTLKATAGATFSGDVTFYDGATVLGSSALTSNAATLATILLPTGTRVLTAHNQPNPDYALSRSNAVMQVVKSVPGTLQPFTTLQAGNSPTSVAVGDFNRDGIADLAVTNQLDDNVSVFLGTGNGNFQPAANYTTSAGPKGLTVGDFNQDGALDLAVATSAGVSILLNNGNGTFQTAQTFALGQGGATVLATGDFNNAGVASIAVGAFGPDVLMIGNNMANFFFTPQIDAPSASGVVVGDFNGDGNPDVAVGSLQGSGLFVLLGNGDMTFQPPSIYTPIPFSPAGLLNSLASGDFNGDGLADLAMGNASGVSILLGKSDGTFQTPVLYPAGKNPEAVAVGDINGDGIADLVVTNVSMSGAGNTLNILLGKGDGTFLPAVSFPVSDSQTGLALGDFNGDGRIDLAVTNYNSKTVSIYLGASVAACKVAATGVAIGVADVQQMINEALGVVSAVHDLNGDGTVNVVDLEIVVSAAVGVGCFAA